MRWHHSRRARRVARRAQGAAHQREQERIGKRIGNHTVNIKSDIYGIIAYHNLTLQDREIMRVREAILAGETARHAVSFSQTHARAQKLVEFMAQIDSSIANALGHVRVELFPRTREEINLQHNVSLTHDPSAFDVTERPDYKIPPGIDRLLILACTQTKPYRKSKSHSAIWRFLGAHAGDKLARCHKVTLSGLYGPVPMECEDEEAVRTYEYVLSSSAKRQQALIGARLISYLKAHMHMYERIVAFVTASAYRQVIETAFEEVQRDYAQAHGGKASLASRLILAPATTRGTGVKDLLSHASLQDLLRALHPDVAEQVDLATGPPVQLAWPSMPAGDDLAIAERQNRQCRGC